MHVGDKVRLRSTSVCQDILGLSEGEVGVVKDIDETCERTTLLISFADTDVYTSALREDDFEGLRPEQTIPF
jgi:hypothetical protein